jgi:hypothetical protein
MSADPGTVLGMTADQTSRRTSHCTMTARGPEDVLAAVPVVLGFEPTESLVMLTFGCDPPFHARADLAERPEEVPEMVESLLAPARRHRVPRVFLLAYSDRDRFAERTLRATAGAFRRAGIEVIDGLRTDGRRWHPVPARPGIPAHGVPYDISTHPFAAQAVYDGRVVHGSRAALEASLVADPDRVAGVVAALAGLATDARPALEEGGWAHDLVAAHVERGTPADDVEVARLLRGMLDVRVRDAAWAPLQRQKAREHVAFWSDVIRRTPDPLVPAPAALLAFAAWQAGQGALAWCAVDRCLEVEPAYSLAEPIARILTEAVPPQSWDGVVDWAGGLADPPVPGADG